MAKKKSKEQVKSDIKVNKMSFGYLWLKFKGIFKKRK